MKKILENLEEYLGGILFFIMLIVLIAQIFSRQILNTPLLWSEELARLIFVYVAILGVILGIKHSQHVAIEIVFENLPKKLQKIVTIFIEILIFATIVAIFIIGIKVTQRKATLDLIALGISSIYLYGALPVGASLMMIRFIEVLIKKKNLNKSEGVDKVCL